MIWPADDPTGTSASDAAPCLECGAPCDPREALCGACAERAFAEQEDAEAEAWADAEAAEANVWAAGRVA